MTTDAWQRAARGLAPGATAALLRMLAPLGVDPGASALLLEAHLLMDERGGPRGLRAESSRLARWGLPLGYAILGLMTGTMILVKSPPADPWVQAWSLTCLLMLAAPVGLCLGTLFDDTDTRVLGALPVDARTRLAVRLTLVMRQTLLAAICLAAGPCLGSVFAHGALVGLVVLPTVTLLALASIVGALAAASSLAEQLLGRHRSRRWLTVAQAFLGATVLGAGSLFVLAAAALMAMLLAGPGESLPLVSYALPPFQAGGLWRLAGGEVTTETVTLGAMAFATPLFLAALALVLARRNQGARAGGRGPVTAEPDAHLMRSWRSRSAEPGPAAPPRTDEERQGAFERGGRHLGAALSLRDTPVLRQGLTMGLSPVLLCLMAIWRMGASLGPLGHWAVLSLWLAAYLPSLARWCVIVSEHPEASWVLATAGPRVRNAATAGVLRATWLRLTLPMFALAAAVAVALQGPAIALDVAYIFATGIILTVEGTLARVQFLPFSIEAGALARKAQQPGKPDSPMSKTGMGLTLPALLGAAALAVVVHVLCHGRLWTMALAVAVQVPLVVRAWRRLDLVRVE